MRGMLVVAAFVCVMATAGSVSADELSCDNDVSGSYDVAMSGKFCGNDLSVETMFSITQDNCDLAVSATFGDAGDDATPDNIATLIGSYRPLLDSATIKGLIEGDDEQTTMKCSIAFADESLVCNMKRFELDADGHYTDAPVCKGTLLGSIIKSYQ